MHRRKVDPADDAKSALFLAKVRCTQLTKAAKSHKQQSKVKFHQFEYIHTAKDLAAKRRRAEEDLRTWVKDKAAEGGVWAEVAKIAADTQLRSEEAAQSLSFQLSGAKEVVSSLSRLIEGGASLAGKSTDVAGHLAEVKDFIEEGLADLKEQQQALEAELRTLDFSEEEQESAFSVPEVPGLDGERITEEYGKACALVDALFDTQLQALQEKEVRNPWPEDAFQRFAHIHRIYVKGGKPRERYFERLLLEFPHLSRESLDAQDRVVEAFRWAQKARKNIDLDRQRHRKALLASAQALLQSELDRLQTKAARDAEFVEQERNLARIDQQYRERSEEYKAKVTAQEAAAQVLRDRQLAETQAKERALKEHAKKTKEVAMTFLTQKEVEAREKQRAAKEQQARAAAKRKANIAKNRPKVQAKRDAEMDRIQQTLELKAQQAQAAESEKARIESAIAGYSHVPKVDLDRNRVMQPTESKKAKKALMDKADAVVLFKQTGFTADNLMKDMRYRLSAALAEAGLAGTEYGKRMIKEAPSAIKPRADMLSTFNML